MCAAFRLALPGRPSQKYKIAGFFERWWHKKGHSIGCGTDVRAGEQRDPKNAHHAIGNMTLTAPVTNNWLVQAGYSFAEFYWKGGPPTGSPAQLAEEALFSPAWIATAQTERQRVEQELPGPLRVRNGLHDSGTRRARSGRRASATSRRCLPRT